MKLFNGVKRNIQSLPLRDPETLRVLQKFRGGVLVVYR